MDQSTREKKVRTKKIVIRVVESPRRNSRDIDHSVGDATVRVVGQGRSTVLEDDGGSVGRHDGFEVVDEEVVNGERK